MPPEVSELGGLGEAASLHGEGVVMCGVGFARLYGIKSGVDASARSTASV